MKQAKLLHNPGAGDEDHNKKDLMRMICEEGFECRYSSTKKKGWDEIEPETEILIVAGGDGTVRDVADHILAQSRLEANWPIALLPLGTANNIAKTLGISGETREIIKKWMNPKIKKFDVGKINGDEEPFFFLESFGYGIFPYLMMEMKKKKKEAEDMEPDQKLKLALKVMHQLVLSYEPRYCNLQIDDVDYSGNFVLVEIMNTRTLGPNLCLAPGADPGDGHFEVACVPAKDKEQFADYLINRVNGKEGNYDFNIIPTNRVNISWDGTHVHVDDEILKIKKEQELKIELLAGALEFYV